MIRCLACIRNHHAENTTISTTCTYTFQGTSRIEILHNHLGTDDMMDELLRTTIEAAKVEVGVGHNLFQLDFSKHEHIVADSWIKETWRFAHNNNIGIKVTITNNLQLHRENDVFLMEIIAHTRSLLLKGMMRTCTVSLGMS
jgi:hypothetical protein